MASAERINAALRLLGPEHITPQGRRVIESVLDEEAQEERNLDDLLARMGELLTETANALKGPPVAGEVHDWSDLPTVAAGLRAAATLNRDELYTHAKAAYWAGGASELPPHEMIYAMVDVVLAQLRKELG